MLLICGQIISNVDSKDRELFRSLLEMLPKVILLTRNQMIVLSIISVILLESRDVSPRILPAIRTNTKFRALVMGTAIVIGLYDKLIVYNTEPL